MSDRTYGNSGSSGSHAQEFGNTGKFQASALFNQVHGHSKEFRSGTHASLYPAGGLYHCIKAFETLEIIGKMIFQKMKNEGWRTFQGRHPFLCNYSE